MVFLEGKPQEIDHTSRPKDPGSADGTETVALLPPCLHVIPVIVDSSPDTPRTLVLPVCRGASPRDRVPQKELLRVLP
jgi:hypothetical protein